MVEDELSDGRRIAQLLASELDGREDGGLAALAVENAADVEGSTDGERAYDVTRSGERLARVFVHPERTRIEVETGVTAAADRAREAGLRVRPKATTPPRTLLFVENGAEVKRAADILGDLGN